MPNHCIRFLYHKFKTGELLDDSIFNLIAFNKFSYNLWDDYMKFESYEPVGLNEYYMGFGTLITPTKLIHFS